MHSSAGELRIRSLACINALHELGDQIVTVALMRVYIYVRSVMPSLQPLWFGQKVKRARNRRKCGVISQTCVTSSSVGVVDNCPLARAEGHAGIRTNGLTLTPLSLVRLSVHWFATQTLYTPSVCVVPWEKNMRFSTNCRNALTSSKESEGCSDYVTRMPCKSPAR